jgi:uncharacterized glyoxalase superfamily protein PhnB
MSPSIFPILQYRDPDAAIEWLKGAFGFQEQAVHRDNGSVVHAELRLDDSLIMLGGLDRGWVSDRDPDPLGSTVSVYIVVEDADAHHARATEAGAQIVRELSDQDYGSRDYSARDPEGNLWSFGTYRPEIDA